ncbi:metal-dependent hydrolase [Candidatus Woesebacteria bacterium]|nr:metal-dependent hydrolase [Candidatus Woesebacteria bacterium]
MTGRTHDVAAFAALTFALIQLPLIPMSLPTAAMAFGANFIGGLFPDIDQPTSDLWDNFRGGEFVSKVVCRFLGGHRHISHSLIGVGLIGFILDKSLYAVSSIILIDMRIVWWSFMIGVVSHLLMDMPTKEGIPLFWPLKLKIGIPPFRFLRIRSGHFVENFIIFPGFCLLILYLLFTNQVKVLDFLHNYIR